VFAVSFMRPEGKEYEEPKNTIFKKWWFWTGIAFGVLFHLAGMPGFGNFMLFMVLLSLLNRYVFRDIIHSFQNRLLPALMRRYEMLLRWILKGYRPVWTLVALFVLFPVSLFLLMARGNKTTFFPSGDPNMIYVYLKMPPGTDVKTTDSVMSILENRVTGVLGNEMPGHNGAIVESVITNVANSANNPRDNNRSVRPNLGRIQISFVEYEKRHGKKTSPYMDSIRAVMGGIPGASMEVAQEEGGPPTDPPVNIEVIGDEFEEIAQVSRELSNYLYDNPVYGVENLRMDVDLNSPEITINVDRQKAMREGLTTGQVGMEIRTALFGKEVSKLKEGEDEYKIQLRYNELRRKNIADLLNMRITFMDMNTMRVKSVPVSAIATIDYTSASGAIARKNVKRTIQLQSNVLDPSMVKKVNEELAARISDFKSKTRIPVGVTIRQTGQGEQEAETNTFLT
ncbi:MAG: AcrB/AcrD/AcrF family protein, partial [Chitinophagaceae bacterium]